MLVFAHTLCSKSRCKTNAIPYLTVGMVFIHETILQNHKLASKKAFPTFDNKQRSTAPKLFKKRVRNASFLPYHYFIAFLKIRKSLEGRS